METPSNIAEGYARRHRQEYLQYLSIAQGALAELDTQFEIAERLGYVSKEEGTQRQERLSALGKQLGALRRSLSRAE